MKQRIKERIQENHVVLSIIVTTAFCALAFLTAFWLRFDFGQIPEDHIRAMKVGLPIMVLIRLAALIVLKVHRGLYRYVSMHDLVKLIQAITLGSICFAACWTLFLNQRYFMPRSIYILEWMFAVFFLVGLRVCVRLWRGYRDSQAKKDGLPAGGRALIVGAGNLGEAVLRIIDRRFHGHEIDVVGFVDNNSMKVGSAIHGVPVLGKINTVADLVRERDVQVIVFAISDPPAGLFERVVSLCDGLTLRFNTVSVLKDMASGEISVEKMRSLNIEDLLGRKPVAVDPAPVRADVAGRIILVTGAGGSIGSELCRQLASYDPRKLILLESGESPLFEIDRELRQRYPKLEIVPYIGDIKCADVLERLFSTTKPDYVYHAAAYKHVPLMEAHPDEAVLNNVRGTRQLAVVARKHKCQQFVMISSDKAVRPTNVMGATKRMCELVIQSMNGGDTIFAAVRFGNVLGSNGSVIPIFTKQIEAGGPLTITDPDMTRYFMTIPEAVSLVLQCGSIAEPEDVFVLDMGTPVKILDLAKSMIRLSGLRENIDISIKVTGLRPGEKMYEELVAYGEELKPAQVPKVNILKQNYDGLACDVLFAMIRRLEELALARKSEKVRELLWRLIEIDLARTQQGFDGLIAKSVRGLVQEWGDTVSIPAIPDGEQSKGCLMAVVSNMAFEPVLSDMMTAIGYELDCLDSEEEALRLVTSARTYSAILCDYILPEGTVSEFRDKVREAGCDIPVVAMSMYDHETLAEVLDIDTSIPVLRKPFSANLFEEALAELALPEAGKGI